MPRIYTVSSFYSRSSRDSRKKKLRDIRIMIYQICRTEENKWNSRISQINMLFESWSKRFIENIVEKRRNWSSSTIVCYLLLNFHVKQGPDFHFEISGNS